MRPSFLLVCSTFSLLPEASALLCIDCQPLTLSTECTQSKPCFGGFCTYYNKTVDGTSELRYACLDNPELNGPGGMVYSEKNKCSTFRDKTAVYHLRICNDTDLCNAKCSTIPIALSLPLFLVSSFVLATFRCP